MRDKEADVEPPVAYSTSRASAPSSRTAADVGPSGAGGALGAALVRAGILPPNPLLPRLCCTPAAMPEPAVLVFVRRVATAFQRAGGHDANCFPSLRILAARPGLVRASVRIRSENLNRLGTLHGGAICSLTDTLGSLALASRGLYSTGVSTDIK